MPRVAGGKEVITQPLYDTQKYALAGSNAPLLFFQTPKGQGASLFGAGPKNLADTNMRAAAQLPSPQTFNIMWIGVDLLNITATQIADKEKLLNSGYLLFESGSKQYLECPVRYLPSGAGVDGIGGTAVGGAPLTTQTSHAGVADPKAVFVLSQPIPLLENENFDVQIIFPDAIALTADTLVRCLLGGELTRSIQ